MQTGFSIHRVIVLGTGRMAGFLIPAFRRINMDVIQVYGRNEEHAAALGMQEGIEWTSSINDIIPDADLYVLAVSDSAIPLLAEKLEGLKGLVVHTSGAVPLEALAGLRHNGVFYPLQTLGQSPPPDMSDTPICIEGSGEPETTALKSLAERMSERVEVLNSSERLRLHLAAVLVNNFANHLYALAESLLKEGGVPYDLLHPLMRRTTALACSERVEQLQTGPAIRGDEDTIRRHLELLKQQGDLAALYRALSLSVQQHHNVKSADNEL